MAGQQRKCANCRFFSDAGMPGNGWCTHPKRQLSSGVKLLVRGGELACRNSWGGDLFQSRLDDDPAPAAAADLPGNDQDDEVTSVTIPSTRSEPAEDRVVRDRPATPRPTSTDTNHAAHRDQDERARIMARGSRDALAHARQRFTARNQTAAGEDVVADDDMPSDGQNDRVVTRQERFSDRDFAAGLPHMRTPPVPREEVRQRSIASQDRFDTVPEIDPNFDMPAQRNRAEFQAAPPPERPSELEPEPVADDQQVTAYEHVLQRARRIRASKQERTRPIRHADLLVNRDATAPVDAAPYEPAGHDQAEDWRADFDEGPVPERESYAAREHHVETWDDSDEEPLEMWADEAEEPLDEWPSEYDDDLGQDEEDDGYSQPEPRRPGWLSRFGLGRRSSEPVYDDAIVTRHAAASHDYLDDDLAEYDPIDEDEGWDFDVHDPNPAPTWNDDVDEFPHWQPQTHPHAYAEGQPAAAPIPPPVPASERSADTWDAPSMPARPANPSRTRQPLDAQLPDLDDMLFEDHDDRMLHAERSTAMPPEPAPADPSGSGSPRDSYFRASRYPQPEPATPFRSGAVPNELDSDSTLPDLDADHLDVRDVVARGAELIDRRIEVAPDIPRQCRTCRSFRSADGGTRGWCTNEWAFTHRRMVNDDDLACVSAIGCWWLPADHLRLDLDDDFDEVRTPRMDELIAGRKPAARRAAGE